MNVNCKIQLFICFLECTIIYDFWPLSLQFYGYGQTRQCVILTADPKSCYSNSMRYSINQCLLSQYSASYCNFSCRRYFMTGEILLYSSILFERFSLFRNYCMRSLTINNSITDGRVEFGICGWCLLHQFSPNTIQFKLTLAKCGQLQLVLSYRGFFC